MKGRLAGAIVATLIAVPAAAQAQVVPVTDCRVPREAAGVFGAYFGYVNPGAQTLIEFGDQNQVVPGLGYQGQPEVFNSGSYPRVFNAIFNSNAFTSVSWQLNGLEAAVTLDTPLCAAGATGPASDVGTTTATLNGVVEPNGAETTYHFEFGESIVYGQTTPQRQLTATGAELVSEPLTGLSPATTYHYRLIADGEVLTAGEDRTFTTASDPPPPVIELVDLSLSGSAPARAKRGRRATIDLRVENRGVAVATGVELIARTAERLKIVGARTPAGPCTGSRVRECSLGGLAAGAAAEVRLRVVPKRRGRLGYAASVVADQPEARVADNLLDGTVRGR